MDKIPDLIRVEHWIVPYFEGGLISSPTIIRTGA
jgi:hypothetical protein